MPVASKRRDAQVLDLRAEMEMRRAAPKTVETYESVLRSHIAPRIGRVPYAALRPVDVVVMAENAALRNRLAVAEGRPLGRETLDGRPVR